MKYLICKKQIGEGCDYTIGCGMKFYFMDAESVEDAVEKIVYPEGRDQYCSLDGENALCEILIIPEKHVTSVDVVSLKNEFDKNQAVLAEAKIEAEEKAELYRLQNKYKV